MVVSVIILLLLFPVSCVLRWFFQECIKDVASGLKKLEAKLPQKYHDAKANGNRKKANKITLTYIQNLSKKEIITILAPVLGMGVSGTLLLAIYLVMGVTIINAIGLI